MVLWQIAGVILGTSGVVALYRGWQRKQRSWPLVLAGWALLLGSIMAWGQTSGIDKGPALGIITVIVLGLAAIGIAAIRTPVKQRREPRVRRAVSPASIAARQNTAAAQSATIITIVLAGLVVSMSACTAMFMGNQWIGMEHTANLTLSMFAFPLVWAGLATFVGYGPNLRDGALPMSIILAISAAIILGTVKAI